MHDFGRRRFQVVVSGEDVCPDRVFHYFGGDDQMKTVVSFDGLPSAGSAEYKRSSDFAHRWSLLTLLTLLSSVVPSSGGRVA